MKQCTYNILALLVFALSFSYVPTAAYEYHCVYDGVTTFNVPIFIFQQVFLATLLFIIGRYGFRDGKMVCWAVCETKKNKKKK
ncbi:hypothetical protein MCECIE61_00115 [Candidatus Methylopumilus planktonicus]|uniref:hypothetical protein n=1 Tax=Candidatus Methylopumilus planktonicus TaxID=1581557 RepID=UPI003BEF29EF